MLHNVCVCVRIINERKKNKERDIIQKSSCICNSTDNKHTVAALPEGIILNKTISESSCVRTLQFLVPCYHISDLDHGLSCSVVHLVRFETIYPFLFSCGNFRLSSPPLGTSKLVGPQCEHRSEEQVVKGPALYILKYYTLIRIICGVSSRLKHPQHASRKVYIELFVVVNVIVVVVFTLDWCPEKMG